MYYKAIFTLYVFGEVLCQKHINVNVYLSSHFPIYSIERLFSPQHLQFNWQECDPIVAFNTFELRAQRTLGILESHLHI